jgi:hypothetical protein
MKRVRLMPRSSLPTAATADRRSTALFPDKNVVDLLPVWGDARRRDDPGFAISRHFAD